MLNHKIKDGEVLKLIPILKKDGSLVPFIKTSYLYLDNKIMIYDTKDYLIKLKSYLYKETSNFKLPPIGVKYWISVFIDNKIKFINVGKSIFEIVEGHYFSINDFQHLHIVEKLVDNLFRDYKLSGLIDKDWNGPIIDDEKQWIKENQGSYIEDFFDANDVLSNITILNESFDNFFVDLITEEREKKLKSLGILDDEERMFTFKELNDAFFAGREENLMAPWEQDDGVRTEFKYEEFKDFFKTFLTKN